MLKWFQYHMLPCPYKSLFGIDCPTCGVQRALLFLLRGDIKSSFLMYPPLVPLLLLLTLLAVRFLKPSIVTKKHIYRYSTFIIALVVINYAVKLVMLYGNS